MIANLKALVKKSLRLWQPSDWIPLGIGGRAAGQHVNDDSMLGLTTAWSCVRLISESVGSLPLQLHQQTDDGVSRVAREHPAYRILKNKPSKYKTGISFHTDTAFSLAVWNQAYVLNTGTPNRPYLQVIPAPMVSPEVSRDGTEIKYRTSVRGRYEELELGEIVPIDGFGWPNGVEGLKVSGFHKNALALAQAAEEYGMKFFQGGGRPTGLLMIDHVMSNEQRAKLRENYKDLLSTDGDGRNSGALHVLEANMKYQKVSTEPAEAQMIEARKWQLLEHCRIWRVPPHKLYELTRVSYNSSEQNDLEFLRHTMMPYLLRIEQAYDAYLLSERDQRNGYFFRFNVEGFLRGDSKSRAMYYQLMRNASAITVNEIRLKENMPPVPNGDDILLPLNHAPADIIRDVLLDDENAAANGSNDKED